MEQVATERKITEFRNYFYMIVLLCFSGNPVFHYPEWSRTLFVLVSVILIIRHYRMFYISEAGILFFYLGVFIVVFAFQYFILRFVSFPGIIGFLLKIIFGYTIISVIGAEFRRYYLDVIFLVALVSLAGFIWNFTGHEIPALYVKEDILKSIVVFTQRFDGARNSGMFWEPGTFACYIVLGFLFYLGDLNNLLNAGKFKLLIIVMALITTFSTTGYIIFFIILVFNLLSLNLKKYSVLILPLILVLLLTGFSVYNKSDFLKEKITTQVSEAVREQGDFSPTRFGSLLFDIYYIKKHFLIGNGIHEITRFADHPWLMGEDLGHGNGFSDFLASMGFLSLFIYSYLLLRFRVNNRWIFLIILLLILQGEPLLTYPMFMSLPFVFVFNEKYRSITYLLQPQGENTTLPA